MIQGDFPRVMGAEALRSSGGQFRFGIKPLNHSAGERAFGTEPVESASEMSAQYPGDALHDE